ncbi:MAG: hypothetical protein K8H88_23795 [Sandaracinaceae bacterium]|nr:hypothetical protein [Sandaracinaceae bacterium]
MADDIDAVLEFLAERQRQMPRTFPNGPNVERVLSFMGTTAAPGVHLEMGVARLLGLDVTDSGKSIVVRLGGRLPRQPRIGECITVSVVNLPQYRGYQIKTLPLKKAGQEATLTEETPGGTLVRGRQVFTVHHGPNVLSIFEQIPRDQVIEDVGRVKYALVGVGDQANISPRFVFHRDAGNGKIHFYHGDGYAHKTYLNVQKNRHESRVVVDPETFEGYRFQGVVEELVLSAGDRAHEKIREGFQAGGWGIPSRVFCLTASRWEPIHA